MSTILTQRIRHLFLVRPSEQEKLSVVHNKTVCKSIYLHKVGNIPLNYWKVQQPGGLLCRSLCVHLSHTCRLKKGTEKATVVAMVICMSEVTIVLVLAMKRSY